MPKTSKIRKFISYIPSEIATKFRNNCSNLYSQTTFKRSVRRFVNFTGQHKFENRSKGNKKLVTILAGFKPDLWPIVFSRLVRFMPADYDLCVACPGSTNAELSALCRQYGWSFLSTAGNNPSLAMNLAIKNHPQAEWIFKFDEDIVIAAGFFESLMNCWQTIETDKRYAIGLLAPLLNVNGYCSRIFLERRERLSEYISRFGEARQNASYTSVWADPEAAAYLWDLSFPFDEIARDFLKGGVDYSACPHRFSIGAFLMQRPFWEAMQGFTVGGSGQLGVDEQDLSVYCMASSHVIACAHHVLAGHVGFGPQTAMMIPRLKGRSDLLMEPIQKTA